MRPSLTALQLLVASSLFLSCAKMPTSPKVMAPVSGTILDRNGNGIQAAYVIFVDAGPKAKGADPAEYRAVTDLNGNYSSSIPEGRYTIFVLPPAFSAYAEIRIDSREVGRGGLRFDYRFNWIRVAIHPSISGGQPVSALHVGLFPVNQSGSDFVFLDVASRPSGNEQEVFVPPGTYDLYLNLNGPGFGYIPQQFRITASADTSIDVAFTGNALSVHVTGQGGAPIPGARVYVAYIYEEARTDASGAVTLYLPSATYLLIASGATDDVLSRTARVPVLGDASIDFDLSGIVWTGAVRRTSDGSPVANAYVYVYKPGELATRASSTTDANGAFHFIVRSGDFYRVNVFESFDNTSAEFAHIDSLPAGADSTFDITVSDSPIVPPVLTPTPPAAPGAPASAAAGPGSRRRSSRTSG